MLMSRYALRLGLGLVMTLGLATAVAADWYPYTVDVWPRLEMRTPRTHEGYVPLDKAEKKWNLCVTVPHLGNEFWLAIDYGLTEEAKRLGVAMRVFEAGGYGGVDTQATQMRDCVANGADAVLVAGVSYDELDGVVQELIDKGMPVINVANDMASEALTAKSLVSFGERSWYMGEYLIKRHPEHSEVAKVGWLPAPGMAGWVFTQHFSDVAKEGAVEIFPNEDLEAVNPMAALLEANPDLKYIAGNPLWALAAADYLSEIGRDDEIKVLAYDMSSDVFDAIKAGKIMAATTDSSVIQGRIAVDQAVRVIEGREFLLHVGPLHIMVDGSNIDDVDRDALLAPPSFTAVTEVN
jgi:protein TorT